MDWVRLDGVWQVLSTLLAGLCAAAATFHVVLRKRDARAAAGWTGLIWLVPLLGPLLYFLLGINRIRRKAASLRQDAPRLRAHSRGLTVPHQRMPAHLSSAGHHLRDLSAAIAHITDRGLCAGNLVEPLVNGDEAYPSMLAAMADASVSISLCTYIFDTKGIGERFIDALAKATARGVEVRVLVDAVGSRYSYPRALTLLKKARVPCASFMRVSVARAAALNLRNHRKIMVVDGAIAFTGGMNIRPGHVIGDHPKSPVRDMHFRIQGPVVQQLQEIFAEDWVFATKELLVGETWFPRPQDAGHILARSIPDGPDEDIDKFTWTVHAALACARRRVVVVSPYFLPDTALSVALGTAALRGVRVDVLIPERSNLAVVQWAMWRQLEEVLHHGVRAWLAPPPFDHTKLMLVDDEWALVGSANWDTRSFRLNFELNVECYDRTLCHALMQHVNTTLKQSREITLSMLAQRPLATRLRDGLARLFMPYL